MRTLVLSLAIVVAAAGCTDDPPAEAEPPIVDSVPPTTTVGGPEDCPEGAYLDGECGVKFNTVDPPISQDAE